MRTFGIGRLFGTVDLSEAPIGRTIVFMDDTAQKDALAFLKRHHTGVLATVSLKGEAHASTVYYTADDDFNLYFLTLINSRKYEALCAHPQVAFTVTAADQPQTLQIEGVAMDITLDEEAAAKKEELFKVLNANPWFYPPLSKLEPADSVVVWVRPTWVRWADYAFAPTGKVFTQIKVAP